MSISVGIYGATGYTGFELVKLLKQHPNADLHFVTSESSAGKSLRESYPTAPDMMLVTSEQAPLSDVQAIFLCLPNTQSAPIADQAIQHGVKVVDLSADLRLDDTTVYQTTYKAEHPAPHLLPAPYGLPELTDRNQIAIATHVANPGCYATSMLLGIAPLAKSGLIKPGTPIIVDAKSGTSGAGRAPKQNILFAEVHGNFSPYNIGRVHRHVPEVEQELAKIGVEQGRLIFSPHLLPTDRGILSSIYVSVTNRDAALEAFNTAYCNEPLIKVLPAGELASLAHTVRSPYAAISLTPAGSDMLIIMVSEDNLMKGAASQAVQNFNLMWGLPETAGLI